MEKVYVLCGQCNRKVLKEFNFCPCCGCKQQRSSLVDSDYGKEYAEVVKSKKREMRQSKLWSKEFAKKTNKSTFYLANYEKLNRLTHDFLKSNRTAEKFLLSIKLILRKLDYISVDELPMRQTLHRWGRLMEKGYPIFEGRGGNSNFNFPKQADIDLEEMVMGTRKKGLCVQWQVLKMFTIAVMKHHKIKFPSKGFPSQSWCSKWMIQHDFSSRVPTQKRLAEETERARYMQQLLRFRISIVVAKHKIPMELVFNMDETGMKLFPGGKRTYAKKNSKDVKVHGLGDKKEVTVTFCIILSYSGEVLTPHLIFAGKPGFRGALPWILDDNGKKTKNLYNPHKYVYSQTESHWQRETSLLEW